MNKLKQRWGIASNFQLAVIFVVFAITGTCSAELAGPVMDIMGIHRSTVSGWAYWPVRILLIFPIYQILLVMFGWLFGQFRFFWEFEKKMLKKIGFSFLLKK